MMFAHTVPSAYRLALLSNSPNDDLGGKQVTGRVAISAQIPASLAP